MTETADIVIIGGGVNGASTAFHLARRGAGRIILLERASLASGATGKSGALVRCHYANRPETELARLSLNTFSNWADEVGGDCGFRQVGALILTPESHRHELEQNVRMQVSCGVNTSIISHAEALEIDPELTLSDVGGIAWEPDAGFADPQATTFAFAAAAERHGAEIRLNSPALEILTEGDRVTGVRTEQGVIHTGTVVLIAGARALQLLTPLGVSDFGLVPTATSVSIFSWAPGRSRHHPVYIDHVTNSWLRPYGDNATLIGTELGAISGIDPAAHPELPSQEYVEMCRERLVYRMPRMKHGVMRGGWTGLIMRSADSHPVIDRLDEYPGLFLVSGDSGTSFKTAPATGLCLSEWILDGQPGSVDLSPFSAARFREGRPWHDEHAYSGLADTISR